MLLPFFYGKALATTAAGILPQILVFFYSVRWKNNDKTFIFGQLSLKLYIWMTSKRFISVSHFKQVILDLKFSLYLHQNPLIYHVDKTKRQRFFLSLKSALTHARRIFTLENIRAPSLWMYTYPRSAALLNGCRLNLFVPAIAPQTHSYSNKMRLEAGNRD